MNVDIEQDRRDQHARRGSILIYVLIVIVTMAVIASLGNYLSTQTKIANRRVGMEGAYQIASGGVSIAADQLNKALQSSPNNIGNGLIGSGYELSRGLSTEAEHCFIRTIPSANWVL